MADPLPANPLISVVTPSFNQGRFIQRCIQSVTAQNYPNFEHIVYDNCSTDGTTALLRGHPHVQWVSAPDAGQSAALNKGIRRARGEIIAWLNADDAYEPRAFAVAARELHHGTGVVAIAGGVHLVDEAGGITRTLVPHFEGMDYLVEYWAHPFGLCQPGVFFRREVVERIGYFRTDLHYAMDYDFWLRLAEHYPVKIVDAVLARYVVHLASKTGAARGARCFRAEWERVSRRYWGPLWSVRRWRRARACHRHAAELLAQDLLRTHKHDGRLDWSLLWQLLRRRPARMCDRYIVAVLLEHVLGSGTWAHVKHALRRRAAGPEEARL